MTGGTLVRSGIDLEVINDIDTAAGPGFKSVVEVATEFFEAGEREIGDGVFVGGDIIVFQVDHVDDAEVDLADVVGVVIE